MEQLQPQQKSEINFPEIPADLLKKMDTLTDIPKMEFQTKPKPNLLNESWAKIVEIIGQMGIEVDDVETRAHKLRRKMVELKRTARPRSTAKK